MEIRPPLDPISLIFMQFSAQILPNSWFSSQTQELATPALPAWEILDPPMSIELNMDSQQLEKQFKTGILEEKLIRQETDPNSNEEMAYSLFYPIMWPDQLFWVINYADEDAD